MSQQNIDFGTFPDDPSADAIRTAFNKVQNNFDQLFGANANTTVTSINRTPGAGITVNFPTGNVVVSANLACLQVSTSTLKMGRGGNAGSNALITQSSQTLVIDINPDQVYSNYFAAVSNGLAVFNGNLSANSNYQANLTSFGNLTGLNVSGRANFTGSNTYISSVSNLHIPGGSAGYGLVTDGAGNLSWSAAVTGNGVVGGNSTEVQFNSSGLFTGNLGFNFTSANGLLQAPLLTVAGNTISANFIGTLANGNSNISITNNSNITFTAISNNTMVISDTGANITGTANVSGNANVGNIGADQGIFTTSANIPIIQNGNSNVTIGANTTVSIYVAGNANAAISATATGANILGIANVTGDIVTAGNISTTGGNGSVQANNFNITGAATGNANVSTVTGNLGIRALSNTYTDNVALASATITNAAIHAIDQPTLTATNASVTFTNAATLYIANSPANSGTTLITNPYSLYIANGSTYFGGANNFILGNLTVQGNATYYNVDSFIVEDPIISLGGGPNGNALVSNDGKDRGTALQYYTTAPVTAFMGWDNGNSEFAFGSNVSIASDVVTYNNLGNARGLSWLGNVDGSYANLSGNLTSANANLGNSAIANYFIGRLNGAANSIANGTSNVDISTTNGNITIGVAGNANIITVTGTGVNVAGTLDTGSGVITTSGNANLGNLGTAQVLASANVTSPQFISNIATVTGAPFSVQSTNRVANLNVSYANVSDFSVVTTQNTGTYYPVFVNANSNANYALASNTLISANLANGALIATTFVGNITGNIGGILANGNSNVSIPASNGNVNITAAGVTTIVVTGTGANITGTANVSGNANILNLGTAQVLASANVTSPQLISNVATGTAPFVVTSTTQVANLSVATAGSATTAGTVTTAAQPNITSTGTLTSLAVTGNISAGNVSGTVLTGTLATAAQPNITSTGTLTSLYVTGNISAGNISATNHTGTTSNITGQYITTLATGTAPLVVTSTTRVANLNVAYSNVSDFGAITAQTTGTYYPVMISAGTSGNYAHAVGPTGISHNLATNTVTATTFAGNLTGNVTASGTVQAANITATAFITRAVTTGVSANGTTQATATGLTTEINIVSTVSVNTGVRLPAAVAGTVVYITNNSANSLLVYPQTNGRINNLGANVGFTQGANATLQFMAPTTTQWYTIGATYA